MGEWSVVNDTPASQKETWKVVYAGSEPKPQRETTSKIDSLDKGLKQGVTLGFQDELAAATDSVLSKHPVLKSILDAASVTNPIVGGVKGAIGAGKTQNDPNATYEQRRDAYREENRNAREDNPIAFGAGQIAGSIAVPVPGATGVSAVGRTLGAIGKGATVGGIAGLGNSEGSSFQDQVRDAIKGSVIGGVTAGVLGAVGNSTGATIGENGPQLTGPVPTAVNAAANAAGKAKSLMHMGGVGALMGHQTGLGIGLLATNAALQAAAKSGDMVARMMVAASEGNVAAQRMIQSLSNTPAGAAKIAALIGTQHD